MGAFLEFIGVLLGGREIATRMPVRKGMKRRCRPRKNRVLCAVCHAGRALPDTDVPVLGRCAKSTIVGAMRGARGRACSGYISMPQRARAATPAESRLSRS